jgi:hypothetical protein
MGLSDGVILTIYVTNIQLKFEDFSADVGARACARERARARVCACVVCVSDRERGDMLKNAV